MSPPVKVELCICIKDSSIGSHTHSCGLLTPSLSRIASMFMGWPPMPSLTTSYTPSRSMLPTHPYTISARSLCVEYVEHASMQAGVTRTDHESKKAHAYPAHPSMERPLGHSSACSCCVIHTRAKHRCLHAPPHLMRPRALALAHSLTHSHSLIHTHIHPYIHTHALQSPTHSPIHPALSFTHVLTHSPTHLLAHSLTH